MIFVQIANYIIENKIIGEIMSVYAKIKTPTYLITTYFIY